MKNERTGSPEVNMGKVVGLFCPKKRLQEPSELFLLSGFWMKYKGSRRSPFDLIRLTKDT
ncbi:MAG: hypothetical protein VKL20_06550 [Synechocystis sp.]|nr:hypothetical protein [Synechocystis sp.]